MKALYKVDGKVYEAKYFKDMSFEEKLNSMTDRIIFADKDIFLHPSVWGRKNDFGAWKYVSGDSVKVLCEPDARYAYRFRPYGLRTRKAFTEASEEARENLLTGLLTNDQIPVVIGGVLLGTMHKKEICGIWNRLKRLFTRK